VLSKNSNKVAANSSSTGPGASNKPTTSAAPTGGATHNGDLRTYLVSSPSGSHAWNKPLGTDKKLTLDQASALSSDASARKKMLTGYNFTQGAVQCWIGSDKTQVDVRLYQFDSATNAQGFYKDDIDATTGGYTAGNVNSIPGLSDAKSFADPKPDAQGYVQALAIGVKGDVVVVVDVMHPATLDIAVPNGILTQQIEKL
jgi:hypothetical protein